jgi:hypothetical protein
MIRDLNKIFEIWKDKVGSKRTPNPKSAEHQYQLREILNDLNWDEEVINELIYNLSEEKNYVDNSKNRALGRVGLPWGSKGTPPEKEEPEDEEGGEEDTQTTGGSTSVNIDAVDGTVKEGGLNGTVKAPGNATSTVNEIGVGYAMACMEEEPDNVEACLDKKLDLTTLGAKASKKKRKQIIQSARAEKKRVDDYIEEQGMNPEKTKVSHVWGAKESLSGCVNSLEEQGIKEVNGIPCNYDEKELYQHDKNGNMIKDKDGKPIPNPIEYDENGVPKNYAQVILNGGGGGDPTDTMVILLDESQDPPKVEILHTSNKTTSADIQANGSPNEEIDQITQGARDEVESEEDKAAVDEVDTVAKGKVKDARKRQVAYISEQSPKMSKQAQDDDTADRMLARLENDEKDDPPGISSTTGKYYKRVLAHPATKAWMKANGVKPPLTPEQKREALRAYAKGISDPNNPNYKLTNADVRILAEFYKDEKLTTGRSPEEPVYSEKEMKSFYEEQTDAMNKHREKLNDIKPGLGDEQYTKRMLERLHIPAPDVPPNFQLNMGEYDRADLKQDKDGNLYEKGDDGKWYKIDENGNPEKESSDINPKELKRTECAVIVDDKTHRHCLGLKEDEDPKEGITVRYTEIKGEDGNYKAIVYDNQDPPNVVAVQTCRSKSGPGGSVNDTIHYGPDYQRCMAKHTIQNDRCG